MKRLIVCCDGTWQNLSSPYPTNVVKIAQAIEPIDSNGIPQLVFYDEGIGAGNQAEKLLARADRILGGAFGIGIDTNIQDAYRFLCLNYEIGDEIYLFGFSRGAYTVRSLAGLIRCTGGLLLRQNIREAPYMYQIYRDRQLTLQEKEKFRQVPRIPQKGAYSSEAEQVYQQQDRLYQECRDRAYQIYRDRRFLSLEEATENPDSEKTRQDLQQKEEKVRELLNRAQIPLLGDRESRREVKITLLGCWDTVGALGVPDRIPVLSRLINRKYKFHDTYLSSIIQNALHAIAIDEIRRVFNVTPMQKSSRAGDQTLEQVWFPGAHGCTGGGSWNETGLSDAALAWMMDRITGLGLKLEFDRTAVEGGINYNYRAAFNNEADIFYRLAGGHWREITGVANLESAQFHESVKNRWHYAFNKDNPPTKLYRPKNLEKYIQEYPEQFPGWKI
ncbi:DUF2235 domain-containing protein [Chroococcidiopsis sp. FACHB-1243]|uniref:DUF2235 domain-containing protein n=1 Tax=Chroococcidiopsis sp. [FACHB-1243] TaxID=2692781 RepID=UPI00177B8C16|nr:DUF2235 domain-containing protein [Chroococcidiopsis sp. [FACHB-1243]]MBD2308523.1 DUF2235 domain-containing protein [Chroococcidiopsis sp. [FACHB-1243]]